MDSTRPNILVIMTDQLRDLAPYENNDLMRFQRESLKAQTSLRESGVTFDRHYIMSAACTPSRASIFTGQYPSLHGVTQTDGVAKNAYSDDMVWLAPDSVPTMGDWFRAGGYRTYYKGKWHVSHAQIDAPDGEGPLQTLDKKGKPIKNNIEPYLNAGLLEEYGFSEWVGPEPHGLGYPNTGTAKDPFTADETIELLKRLDQDGSKQPWLTVCSFLNPHDIALFGALAVAQGLRYDRSKSIPSIPKPPTQKEDLSTKPTCHQSYVDVWGKMLAPQPWIEAQRRFYYQLQRSVDKEIERVLDTLKSTRTYDNTIIIFTSDHGDMLGAHGGMHQKWHNAYEETTRVPFIVAGHLVGNGARRINVPTSHADLLPTMLGLAGIDQEEALKRVSQDHSEAQPLVGRDLSDVILDNSKELPDDPVLFFTDDEISKGDDKPNSPFQRWARKRGKYETVAQPCHVETIVARLDIDGGARLVKLSRYHDNKQFWTEPDKRDDRLRGKKTLTVTEPAPDEYELYDLTLDPMELHNLAHPSNSTEWSQKLQARMTQLLIEQLKVKRRLPTKGKILPGYRPPKL